MADRYRIGVNIAPASNASGMLGALSRDLLKVNDAVGTVEKGFGRVKSVNASQQRSGPWAASAPFSTSAPARSPYAASGGGQGGGVGAGHTSPGGCKGLADGLNANAETGGSVSAPGSTLTPGDEHV